MNFWSKRIKSKKDLANVLGVEESKIDALVNDELTIGGDTMDKTLQAIETEKINKAIRENDIWRWIQETDFKEKRLEFGYSNQKEVARLVGCDSSIICNLENHKEQFKRVSPKLIDIYNFYTNDFNKKINKDKPKSTTTKLRIKVNKDNKHIWKWYKNTNIRELRKSKGYDNLYDLVKLIGVSQSCLSDLELKHFKTLNKTIINAYNFYNKDEISVKEDTDAIYEWYKSIEDIPTYRRAFGYSLNKFMSELNLSYDQTRAFERHEYKSATNVVKRIYDFYHNEDKRLGPIVWEPTENNAFVVQKDEQSFTKSIVDANYSKENDEIEALKQRIKDLELQISRYEKLIDRL